jgi:conjugal transfer/entry exclusion protein
MSDKMEGYLQTKIRDLNDKAAHIEARFDQICDDMDKLESLMKKNIENFQSYQSIDEKFTDMFMIHQEATLKATRDMVFKEIKEIMGSYKKETLKKVTDALAHDRAVVEKLVEQKLKNFGYMSELQLARLNMVVAKLIDREVLDKRDLDELTSMSFKLVDAIEEKIKGENQ